MRLSADSRSPFYDSTCKRATILFNGLRVRDVVEADEEGGWIRFHRRNAAGCIWPNRARDGIREATAKGFVKIVIRSVST